MMFFLMRKFLWNANRRASVRWMRRFVVAGLAISVAALIITASVAGGFEEEFRNKLLDFHSHVTIFPSPPLEISIEELTRRFGARPFVYREALLIHDGKIRGAVLKGVEGSHGGEGILVGEALAKEFGLAQGGDVSLLVDAAKQKKEKLPVSGFFKTGLYEIDDNFAILDLKTITKLFPGIEKNIGLEIWLDDPFQAEAVARNLREEFPPLDIRDWIELNRPIFAAFTLEKWFFRIFIGLMVFVAAMNLVGAVLLSIFQRKPEIAILRVLGQSPRKICLLFAAEGFFLGGVAIAAGTVVALVLLWCLQRYSLVAIDPEIYFLERLPVALHWPELAVLLLSCLALVVLISRWVAGRVKNLPLREGLHKVG